MAQQTAISWLQDKLNSVKPTQFCSIETIKEWIEQAKQMEKEQIRNAIIWGTDIEAGLVDRNFKIPIEEQYYNETYKK